MIENHRHRIMAWKKEVNTQHFFLKYSPQSVYLPPFPPLGCTPRASHLPFCSHIHSLHTLPFLQGIKGNFPDTLANWFPWRVGLWAAPAEAGRAGTHRSQGLSTSFHLPRANPFMCAALSRGPRFPFLIISLTPIPPAVLGVGHLPVAANLWSLFSISPLP